MQKNEMTDEAHEIWSTIRYLDPDEKHSATSAAAIITVLVLALLICMVLIEFYVRGL